MSKRGDQELLLDIIEAIDRINEFTKDMSYEMVLNDKKTQDAVIRNIEIIGEASKNISNDLKSKEISIPWKEMAGTRDRLVHNYFGVNFDVVWGIVENELESVCMKIKNLL